MERHQVSCFEPKTSALGVNWKLGTSDGPSDSEWKMCRKLIISEGEVNLAKRVKPILALRGNAERKLIKRLISVNH